MKDLIYPNKDTLQKEYLRIYGEKFLLLNNLKVDDEIELLFPYERVSIPYKLRELCKYIYKMLCMGILKLDEDGCLYAESIDELDFYESRMKNKGRNVVTEYWHKKKKSIVKFGTGFIH